MKRHTTFLNTVNTDLQPQTFKLYTFLKLIKAKKLMLDLVLYQGKQAEFWLEFRLGFLKNSTVVHFSDKTLPAENENFDVLLKVSKFQKQIFLFSFAPKMNKIIF